MKNKVMKLGRMKKGLTQLELGERVGIKERDITLIETGRREPSPVIALRIAKELGVEVNTLFPEVGFGVEQ